ncbi:MAG: GDP-mannose 4,6-dehydratase [Calditrichaeota bacterium]|nr:GDP-mannose 4,6-dehydratase [Calditrichota bacterium]MCB0290138.1 GDP-mannose 4,6-dehydratase [Calditrichota bacterium]
MKQYLVTGCAGFIGAKVAEKLLAQGQGVVGIDDLNDYYDPGLKEWRLRQLQSHDNFQFTRGDVRDRKTVEALYQSHHFDATFNLAARAGVRASVEDPWIYYQTNTEGTLNLLECSRQYGVNKFMLASTSSIYGMTDTPFSVSNRTDTPLSPYAASKKAAEAMAYSYHYLYGIDVFIPRYFTVYGPAGRPDMSYFNFILKIDKGLPIDVFGDGGQSRDFTFVDDVADATVRGLALRGYHIYNVGNDRPVELLKMIRLLEQLMEKEVKINFHDRHPADNLITWADLSETEKLLNWKPGTPLETGLRKVLEWYRENREWLSKIKISS